MQNEYSRDLVGYGAKPPRAKWPGGARVALNFVLNYHAVHSRRARKMDCTGEITRPGGLAISCSGSLIVSALGQEANRRNLEVAIDCAYRQDMFRFTVEELFQ